jgi:cell wall-associated NlpC family hydrolase
MEALSHLGEPYVWGGESPGGFDCSGLVRYLYAQHGVGLPRVADSQARVGTSIPPSALQAGDAVFFADSSGYIGHEGLYIGNGQFVHAPHTGDVVKVSSLLDGGYAPRYAGARRYA